MYQHIELPDSSMDPKDMRCLSDHNEHIVARRDRIERWRHKAGVLCDRCDTQMLYVNEMVLASNPAKREVKCPNCNHVGYKIV